MLINHQYGRRKRFFTRVFLTLLLITGCYPLSSSPKSLELSIKFFNESGSSEEITTYSKDEDIKCHIILTNILKRDNIIANTRFHIGYEASKFKEICFYVTDPNGKDAESKKYLVIEKRPDKNDIQEIEANKFAFKECNLSILYFFREEGLYTIRAEYQNKLDPDGISVWKGKVKSDPVKIRIK